MDQGTCPRFRPGDFFGTWAKTGSSAPHGPGDLPEFRPGGFPRGLCPLWAQRHGPGDFRSDLASNRKVPPPPQHTPQGLSQGMSSQLQATSPHITPHLHRPACPVATKLDTLSSTQPVQCPNRPSWAHSPSNHTPHHTSHHITSPPGASHPNRQARTGKEKGEVTFWYC